MVLRLPPQLEEAIRRKAEEGGYTSVADLLSQALDVLDEREHLRQLRLQKLRDQVQLGLDQAERGEGAPLDMEQVIEKARQRRGESARDRA